GHWGAGGSNLISPRSGGADRGSEGAINSGLDYRGAAIQSTKVDANVPQQVTELLLACMHERLERLGPLLIAQEATEGTGRNPREVQRIGMAFVRHADSSAIEQMWRHQFVELVATPIEMNAGAEAVQDFF